jgi:hypothetical protein
VREISVRVDTVEANYKEAAIASDQDKARFLLETLGPRIAAVGVGLADARQLRPWAQGASRPRGDAGERLRVLYRIARAVSAVYGPDTAAAFVRGANPGLDDESVLSALRDEAPSAALERRLMGVVRDFLEG